MSKSVREKRKQISEFCFFGNLFVCLFVVVWLMIWLVMFVHDSTNGVKE